MPNDLFSGLGQSARDDHAPLAWKMRPRTLSEVVGQDHLVGSAGILSGMLKTRLRSAIFYGPPGTGKTTVAQLLAGQGRYAWGALSATEAGSGDLRKVAERARERWDLEQRGTVLFVDEIHRFNRSQQDILLPFVEDGTFVLIGATTENPWISLNPALLSRCLLVEFHTLDGEQITNVLSKAWQRRAEWMPNAVTVDDEVLAAIAGRSGGDVRLALGLLERLVLAQGTSGENRVTEDMVSQIGEDSVHYHDRGDRHYDLTSALIKSIRGSDPDAALYWFGRLLAGGEDPRFIARRLIVHASEDVGLADPQAMLIAHAASHAVQTVGLPEARIPMAQAVLYLSLAPKSHSVVAALSRMEDAVQRWPQAPVPESIRDRHYRSDQPNTYRYPHDTPDHFLPDAHLPEDLRDIRLYQAESLGVEPRLASKLDQWRTARSQYATRLDK